MGLPAVLAAVSIGKGLFDFFSGKRKEKKAVNDARQQFDSYYASPGMQAINAFLRDYWNRHNLGERATGLGVPNLLEDLLRAPQWNDRMAQQFRTPGLGGGLANSIFGALSSYYQGTRGRSGGSSMFGGRGATGGY